MNSWLLSVMLRGWRESIPDRRVLASIQSAILSLRLQVNYELILMCKIFFVLQSVRTKSECHSATCSVSNEVALLGVKAAGTWDWTYLYLMQTLKVSVGVIPTTCSSMVCPLLYRYAAFLFAHLKYQGISIRNVASYLDVEFKVVAYWVI